MPVFKKGSKQAKDYMAKIRAMKGTKKVAVKKNKVAGYTKGSSKFIEQGEKPVKGQTNYRVTRNENTLLTKGGTFKNFAKLSGYAPQNEIIIGKVSTEKKLKDLAPQVKLRISRGKAVDTIIINSGQKSVDVFKKYVTKNMIETQEFFAVMYLNNANKCLGVYLMGQGGYTSVVAERRLLMSGALLIGATSLILCHNHPSGKLEPSPADKQYTKNVVAMANDHDIRVLDHVIITKDSFFSFAESGLL